MRLSPRSLFAAPLLLGLTAAPAGALALQVGTTNGGHDGSVFTRFGEPDVPIGWPLRYSHSPAEVIDLKDLVAMADLVRAIAERW
jgi:putative aminopeptidase FrvX